MEISINEISLEAVAKEQYQKFVQCISGKDIKIPNVLVFVHMKIQNVMDSIIAKDSKLTNQEYGLYLESKKVNIGNTLVVVVSDKYYLPEQEVTTTSISFKEGSLDINSKFNAVIHRHPEGVNNFSSVDNDSINTDFDVSLLYQKSKGIFRAAINLNSPLFEDKIGLETSDIIFYY